MLGENDILNDDETPTNGVLKINMEGTDYDKFSIKITGIADAQKETKFMVGAYVIDRGTEKTEISYINQGIKDEGDKYCYITYNGLVKE